MAIPNLMAIKDWCLSQFARKADIPTVDIIHTMDDLDNNTDPGKLADALLVEEIKKSVSDGKELVAGAITEKGIVTAADATFQEMADNIGDIETGSDPILQEKSDTLSTAKTSTVLTPNNGYDGLSKATVSITTQTKSVTPNASTQTVTPDSGKVLSEVTVNAISTQEKTAATPSISAQTITPDSGKYLTKVTVPAVPTETKSATLSTSAQTITPSSGKFLSSVSVPAVTGTAVAGDVLTGKTFNSATAGISKTGTMANKGSTTQDAALSIDDNYVYLNIPSNGYYNTDSKLRTNLRNIGIGDFEITGRLTSQTKSGEYAEKYFLITFKKGVLSLSNGEVGTKNSEALIDNLSINY